MFDLLGVVLTIIVVGAAVGIAMGLTGFIFAVAMGIAFKVIDRIEGR